MDQSPRPTSPPSQSVALAPPPEEILYCLETLWGAGYEAWIVGGSVRDRILSRTVNDWDVTTNATPEEVSAIFPRTIPTGIEHGTVTVLLSKEESETKEGEEIEEGERKQIEVTTYRVDGEYRDGRRPNEVQFTRSLPEDLARRDLTVNAIAWDPLTGALVDPFEGARDIRDGLLRAVGEAPQRFAEDGLRVMRAIRFSSTLRFTIVTDTWRALSAPAALKSFSLVARERIQSELNKILDGPAPGLGFELLERAQLIHSFWAPLAEAIEADPAAWRLRLRVIDKLPPQRALRLALLLSILPEATPALLRTLRYSNQLRAQVAHFLGTLAIDPETPRRDRELRALVAAVRRDAYPGFLLLRQALDGESPRRLEAWAALAKRIKTIRALQAPQSPRELAISGHELCSALSLRPGRVVGQLLQGLLEHVWEHPESNERGALLAVLPALCTRLKIPSPNIGKGAL